MQRLQIFKIPTDVIRTLIKMILCSRYDVVFDRFILRDFWLDAIENETRLIRVSWILIGIFSTDAFAEMRRSHPTFFRIMIHRETWQGNFMISWLHCWRRRKRCWRESDLNSQVAPLATPVRRSTTDLKNRTGSSNSLFVIRHFWSQLTAILKRPPKARCL